MKILSVTLQNLNSLAGTWTVDFTNDAFVSTGIFAITGPTGSGKTTLLDAICLALYGRTPRLENITKTENEIMSRRAGECSAEVTFSCRSGVYICTWHQHRSRRKADGKLQSVKHYMNELSGKPLDVKSKDVPDVVAEKTGLSFTQFTRSVMLAQGKFGAFLEAKPADRSPILEQITGTEIYSEISKSVHERKNQEEDQLQHLTGQRAQVQVLSDEERSQKMAVQMALRAKLTDQEAQQAKLQQAVVWRQSLASLQKDVETLTVLAAEIRGEKRAFAPKQARLEQAQKAASLAAGYRELELKRERVFKTANDVELLQKQMPEILARETQLASVVMKSDEQLKRAQDAYRRELEVQQRVRELDVRLGELNKQLDNQKRESTRLHHRLDETKALVKRKADQIDNLDRATDKSRAYLEKHASDEKISQCLSAVEATFRQMTQFDESRTTLENERREILVAQDGIENDLLNRQSAVNAAADHCRVYEDEIRTRTRRIQDLEDGVSLKAHKAQLKLLLEKRRLADRVRQLEDERKRLADGVPCPLCGATEHPFASGQHPQLDEVDVEVGALEHLIDTIERENSALGECKDALTTRQQALQTKTFEVKNLHQKIDELKGRTTRIDAAIEKVATQRVDAFGALQQYLKPFFSLPIQSEDVPAIMTELTRRMALWSDAHQSIVDAAEKKQQLLMAQKAAESKASEIEKSVMDANAGRVHLEHERTPLVAERQTLYGDKSPDEEAARWQARMTALEDDFQKATRQRDQVKTELTRHHTTIEKLTGDRLLYTGERDALEPVFAKKRVQLGFSAESDFVSAIMDPSELQALESIAQQLHDKDKSVRVRLADKSETLASERKRALTEQSELELQEDLRRVRALVKTQSEELGAIQSQLTEDEKRRKEADAMHGQIEAQRTACLKWQRLHDLIGSADGKKYRNFAQGLTFRRLVTYANVQLVRMTDRYLLHPSVADQLEFSVMDNHQAGEFRSTRNLSGGESFIVSLALALGLAQMSSHKVQIDSLFLDEGFGTLDDEALDTALDTLSRLHQEGKLIGVISHVPALKERISCRIQVIRQSGGISRLEGPGCNGGQ